MHMKKLSDIKKKISFKNSFLYKDMNNRESKILQVSNVSSYFFIIYNDI